MFRLIVAISILLLSACPAVACIMAMTPAYNPNAALELYSRDDIVKSAEVIVEGVIEPTKSGDGVSFARMHIDRVWKGDLASDVVVIIGLGIHLCPVAPPPLGERMRFSARLVGKRL